jgi:hypothetical protein
MHSILLIPTVAHAFLPCFTSDRNPLDLVLSFLNQPSRHEPDGQPARISVRGRLPRHRQAARSRGWNERYEVVKGSPAREGPLPELREPFAFIALLSHTSEEELHGCTYLAHKILIGISD